MESKILKNGGKSEVKFITNEKLKIFIKEIQTVFKAELEATCKAKEERNYEELLRIQYYIRQYIIKNQHRIDFSSDITLIDKNPKSMPSLFGLYMMVVSKIEEVNTIVDVMKQIDRRFMCGMGIKHYCGLDASGVVFQTEDLGNTELLCCCSHYCNLDNLAIIRNNRTECCVIIGSECINKNKLIDADVIKAEREKTEKFINKKKIADDIKADKKRIADEIKADKRKIADDIRADKKKIADEIRAKKEEEKRIEKEKKIKYDYRYPINVKYHQKEHAKEYGARWDAPYKQWYIPPRCKHTFYLKQEYDNDA